MFQCKSSFSSVAPRLLGPWWCWWPPCSRRQCSEKSTAEETFVSYEQRSSYVKTSHKRKKGESAVNHCDLSPKWLFLTDLWWHWNSKCITKYTFYIFYFWLSVKTAAEGTTLYKQSFSCSRNYHKPKQDQRPAFPHKMRLTVVVVVIRWYWTIPYIMYVIWLQLSDRN